MADTATNGWLAAQQTAWPGRVWWGWHYPGPACVRAGDTPRSSNPPSFTAKGGNRLSPVRPQIFSRPALGLTGRWQDRPLARCGGPPFSGSRSAACPVRADRAIHPVGVERRRFLSPTFVELSDSERSGSVTYVPSRWGSRSILLANDAGLRDPKSMLTFVAKVQVGSSGTSPSGNRGPDLGGFDFFARGALVARARPEGGR